MEIKDEGVCRFCFQTFAGRAMGRHLAVCKAKRRQDNESAAKVKKTYPIYHLRIVSYKPFWLHVEVKASATLADLDDFLRRIWLECCGHLSEFQINGVRYIPPNIIDDWWDRESKSMDIPLNAVFSLKDKFEYRYDFGSTTHIEGQVYGQRRAVMKEKIRILSRNVSPRLDCSNCGTEATQIDLEGYDKFYCDACMEELGYEYEMFLPVVNSPRMGVCGYEGELDFDNFQSPTR
jgi:hypothetical protein